MIYSIWLYFQKIKLVSTLEKDKMQRFPGERLLSTINVT
jgi:hypothetical protein